MRRTVSRDEVEALIARGLDSGGAMRQTMLTWSWDISGGCLTPHTVELVGTEPAWRAKARGRRPPRIFLDLDVPCRRCEPCRKRRAMTWAAKAHTEIEQSYRTWFVTLTMNDRERYLSRARAQKACAEDALDFEALSSCDQFRAWVKGAYPNVQRYIKRLRKEAGPLRYLCVAEAHNGGGPAQDSPHFHLLIHEPTPLENLKEKMLRTHWRGHGHGFAEAKLADAASAWYCCKYLTKETNDRVRASFKYGEQRTEYALEA